MPKIRKVTLDGGGNGSDYTIIRASIGAHITRIYEDGERASQFVYKRKEDDFEEVLTTDVGDVIILRGSGRKGIYGRGPNYSGLNAPAETAAAVGDSGGGDIICHIKASTTATPDVVVFETESEGDEGSL